MARGALTALAVCWLASSASADDNDLVLSRLATRITDSAGRVVGVVGQRREFRALASQLGVVLAPHLLAPADTLGFGGFQFSIDGSQTQIASAEPYWRVLAGSRDPDGTRGIAHGASALGTIGVFAHKGLWLPLPSFELGAGARHLVGSKIWAAQAYGKLALNEGNHDLPIPSIALRAAVSRMMSQRELDLTVASLDLTISRHIGIAGTWRLDPFAGWDLLAILPRSGLLDATPGVDPLRPGDELDAGNNFAFRDQAMIFRQRLLIGAKLQYAVVQLTIEVGFALAGSSTDDRPDTTVICPPSALTTDCDARDSAAAQTTVSASAGLDF